MISHDSRADEELGQIFDVYVNPVADGQFQEKRTHENKSKRLGVIEKRTIQLVLRSCVGSLGAFLSNRYIGNPKSLF
ncbi:MAG TPA: hypothetical protein V6C86_20310 [Oculatellaceae cyanobacterium]